MNRFEQLNHHNGGVNTHLSPTNPQTQGGMFGFSHNHQNQIPQTGNEAEETMHFNQMNEIYYNQHMVPPSVQQPHQYSVYQQPQIQDHQQPQIQGPQRQQIHQYPQIDAINHHSNHPPQLQQQLLTVRQPNHQNQYDQSILPPFVPHTTTMEQHQPEYSHSINNPLIVHTDLSTTIPSTLSSALQSSISLPSEHLMYTHSSPLDDQMFSYVLPTPEIDPLVVDGWASALHKLLSTRMPGSRVTHKQRVDGDLFHELHCSYYGKLVAIGLFGSRSRCETQYAASIAGNITIGFLDSKPVQVLGLYYFVGDGDSLAFGMCPFTVERLRNFPVVLPSNSPSLAQTFEQAFRKNMQVLGIHVRIS